MSRALLLIDCQRLFLDPESPAVLPGAARAARRAREMLEDWRAAGGPVAHVRFETRRGTPMAGRWRAVRGRWAQAWPPLAPRSGEGDFVKHGYSALRGTPLAGWLRRRGVRSVTLAGFMTDACVLVTAFDAFGAGFEVVLAEDASGARTPALKRAAAAVMSRRCARVGRGLSLPARRRSRPAGNAGPSTRRSRGGGAASARSWRNR